MPIRPGTDAALALGMMHVLWRDGLQDDDYLQRYCLGADQLRERVLKEYPPAKVADDHRASRSPTSRSWRTTTRTIRPALIRLNYGLQRHGGGGMAVRDHHLPARDHRRLAARRRRRAAQHQQALSLQHRRASNGPT